MGALLVFLACWLPAVTKQEPSFLITAPNVVHVGQDETITLQVFESSAHVAVTIYFEKQTGKAADVISSRKYTAELNQGNNFTQVILVQILPAKTIHLNFLREAQYATLVAEIAAPFHVTRKASIRLRSRPYFIYVVTDKPIYAPDETVHYQVFTLDQEMKPTYCTITVEVLDSKGTVLSTMSEENYPSSVHFGEINIQSKMNDTYQIRAKVSENSEYYGFKKFQVQKYEFPRFDVQIIPDHWYYVASRDTYPLTIRVMNKIDSGLNATVMFGLSLVSGQKEQLPQLDQHLQMVNGKARVMLQTTDLIHSIRAIGELDDYIGSTFYIAADVSDNNYTGKKVLENIAFRLSPYNIDFASMKPYFTPGAPFHIPISVTYPDGSPAPNVSVNVEVRILTEKVIEDSIEVPTDLLGEIIITFTIPPNALDINVTARAGNTPGEIEKTRKVVKRHQSNSRRYLHISVPHVLLFPGDIITVNLTALGLLDSDHVHHFYYMVLGKGKVLDFQRVERRPETSFELPVTQAMVPYFRIVAYYILHDNGRREIIADSIRVEAESLCDTKFQVLDSVLHEEGDHHQLLLSLLSDNPAKIFTWATDSRLTTLNPDDSITPRMVFEDLNSTDIGLSSGSGNNTASVFRDSGLIFISDLMAPFPKATEVGRAMVTITQKDARPHGDDGHTVPSTFSGSSMWELDTTPGNKTFRLMSDVHLSEYWEIHTLSLSEEDGLCLARPMMVQTEGICPQPTVSATPERATHDEGVTGVDNGPSFVE